MAAFDPSRIERPDLALMKYYVITALLTGPLSIFIILPLFFKYETLRYKFDSDGMSSKPSANRARYRAINGAT
jgi:putative membrane protein